MPDSSPSLPPPVDLDNIERAGAIRFGRHVKRLIFILDDDERGEVPCPEPVVPVGAWKLTPTQAEIVRILRLSPTPLPRFTVAKKLGRDVRSNKDVTGRLAEDFRKLLSLGAIFAKDGMCSDDRKKFGDAS